MLSPDQIQQLIKENKSLQKELQEVNYILEIKEQEMAELKKIAATTTEMRSMLDTRLDELEMMQNQIGKQQQRAEGAEDRELELQQELTAAIQLQHQYNDLFQQYNYVNTQLTDVQEELAAVKKKNKMLQQIAVQVGELESTLENLTLERNELKNKIYALENEQAL
jgi:chromosome segregation ATPase